LKKRLSLGLDFGTNSVRALLTNVANGKELATAVYEHETGQAGIILDPQDPNLARQNPADYVVGTEVVVKVLLAEARKVDNAFSATDIIGIGVDTTGSTPLPVDRHGTPLSFKPEFKDNPNAQAWLWKDHTAYAEAAMITELAARVHPEYLAKCGGTYSSEWFFSKLLHCLRQDPRVFEAAYSWVECCDYIPGLLTGITDPLQMKRSRCAAGHKAMFNENWGGLPSKEFLSRLDPKLGELRSRLYEKTYTSDKEAGKLAPEWADRLGLPAKIPVAVGAGPTGGGYSNFGTAQRAMCGTKEETFRPNPEGHKIYQELYKLYAQLHDAFGTKQWSGKMYNVMKDLLAIRDRQRKHDSEAYYGQKKKEK
jgi:L-ribulokinase